MAKKLYIKTFGCQMNEYDSDRMVDVLAAEGIEKTDSPEDADVILFNTCSVREKAQEKVFHDLGRVRLLKQAKPDLVIGVGGCVASQEGEAIVRRAPYVDLVFGPQTLHRLPQLIRERRASGRPQVDVSFPEIEKFDALPPARVEGGSAFVSVMEGCSKFCTYCIVPYTRGEEISRPLDGVLAEIAGLAAQGVLEVTLLGQNVNAYRGLMDDGEAADFAFLLRDMGLELNRAPVEFALAFQEPIVSPDDPVILVHESPSDWNGNRGMILPGPAMFPLHFLFSVLVLFRLCKRGKDVVPVDDPDKAVAVKDWQPADVVFHEQFRGSADRLPRCDSHDIR